MDWLLTYADPTIDWNYALITLVVRFIGVFIVMAVVQVAMQVASRIVISMEQGAAKQKAAKAEKAARATKPAPASLDISGMADDDAPDGRTVAAIALALAIEQEQASARTRPGAASGQPRPASGWGMAGRLRAMR